MGIQLTPEEQREIFGDDWQGEEYAAEAEQRWGETDAWKQAQSPDPRSSSKADWLEIKAEADALEADSPPRSRGRRDRSASPRRPWFVERTMEVTFGGLLLRRRQEGVHRGDVRRRTNDSASTTTTSPPGSREYVHLAIHASGQ